jgi:hypothetical protein
MVIAAMNDQGRHADFLHAKAGNSAFNKFQHESGSLFWIAPEGKAAGRCRDPIPAFTIQNIAGRNTVIRPKRPSTDGGLLSRDRAG